jgi:hypothetical protein
MVVGTVGSQYQRIPPEDVAQFSQLAGDFSVGQEIVCLVLLSASPQKTFP